MPTACQASLAPNQSRNKRCPADNLAKSELTPAPEQAGTRPHGARLHDPGIIGTRASQSTSKEGGLIHMCSMKLPIYYPAAPFFSPSSRSQPDNLSPPQPGLLLCNAAPVLLPEFSPRFDHNFQGCKGVRGRLRLLATWKDFSGSRVCPRSFLGPVPSFTVSVKLEHLSITVQLGLRMWDEDWSLRRECGLPEVSTSYCTQTDNPGM